MTATSTRLSPTRRPSTVVTLPDDVRGHNGEPLNRTRDFFQPPPPEVGKIYTAHSTLPVGREPQSLPARLMLTLFAPALILFLAYWFGGDMRTGGGEPLQIVLIILALIAFLIGWYYTGFRHTCSYVGEHGVARYTLKGAPGSPVKSEHFSFSDAVELRTGQTRNYYNGVYTGTAYHFDWSDAAGKKRFRLAGNYRSAQGTPKADDRFWFARAAEQAWNMRQLEALQRELDANGFCQFNLGGTDFVRVGPGFFEFSFKGEIARINADEIKSLNLNNGQFAIHHKDAKWFSRKGKFSFPYDRMANAQLFLLALEKLAGFSFGNA